MKAAIVQRAGTAPVYGDFREPVAAAEERRIAVGAAALSPVVKSRAAGAHYSSPDAFPLVVGIDGVGRLDDGRRVYFILPKPPFGSMAEWAVVPAAQCVAVPDGLTDVFAAAIANPGLSSWAALKERARFAPGETVLINGATGTSGRLAVQIAKHLGAKTVIATGRNEASLQSLKAIGADRLIPLTGDTGALDSALQREFARGIDVVLDYLWGTSAERILVAGAKAAPEGAPIRFVQIGNSVGANISLPAAALRSTGVELMGSGLGSVPLNRIVGAIGEVLQAAVSAGFDIDTRAVALSEVGHAWPGDTGRPRIVFTVGASGR